MRALSLLLPCGLFLLAAVAPRAQPTPFTSAAEEAMLRHWQEQRELPVPLVRALLLAEGVTDSVQVAGFESVVEGVLVGIDRHIRAQHSAEKKAKTIFKRLHRDVLKRYDEDAQLTDLADGGRFNCVTGTVLFYLAARRHGVPVALYVTPVHVYAVADPAGADLRIEITDPRKGFDFDDEREDVIEHLLTYKMITPEELEFEGEDAIYRTFIEDEWLIQPEALVGIVYNNEAATDLAEERYDAAVRAYEKALMVEPERDEYGQAYAGAFALLAYAHSDDPAHVLPVLRRALEFRQGDETFAEVARPAVGGLTVQLIARQEFERAAETVGFARAHLPPATAADDALLRLEAGVFHDWATSMMRRGDYETAWAKSEQAYTLAPDEGVFREGYVFATCHYASYLAQRGEADAGLDLVESLMELKEQYPIVGETYVRLVAFAAFLMPEPLAKTDPETAKALLRRAIAIAPDMPAPRTALSALYHKEAMAAIRADNYDEAATLIEEGLQHDPHNVMLREDLDLIQAAQ